VAIKKGGRRNPKPLLGRRKLTCGGGGGETDARGAEGGKCRGGISRKNLDCPRVGRIVLQTPEAPKIGSINKTSADKRRVRSRTC